MLTGGKQCTGKKLLGNRQLIVEDEQDGKAKALYGKAVLKTLSQ